MRIAIIGSGSFIGANFIEFTSEHNIDEICLIKNKIENIDLSKYEVVLHLAAIVHQSKEIDENEYFLVNCDLAFAVAQKAKIEGVKHFIFLSTVKVYGESKITAEVWNEETITKPVDAYGRSKLKAENLLKSLEDKNFILSIIRSPLVYGRGVKANIYKLIRFVDKLPILPFAGIDNRRTMINVRNLIEFIKCVIDKRINGVFLAKDDENISTSELIEIISNALHKRRIWIKVPKLLIHILRIMKPGLIVRLYGSLIIENSSTVRELGYKQKFSIDEGLFEAVQYYLITKEKK